MGAITPPVVKARKNSTGTVFIRPRINIIEGSGVTVTMADDATDNEIDITIATAGGAGDMVLADVQIVTGAKTFGTIGGAVDKFVLAGSTSGSSVLNASAVAGSTTMTLPTASTTLVGTDTTDTLTNKTLTSPTLTTPALGVATATSINVLELRAVSADLNTFVGILAGDKSSAGNAIRNTFLGDKAGRGPGPGTYSGSYNVGVGASSFLNITSGSSNTGIGHESLKALSSGADNTAVGESSLGGVTSGSSNCAVGVLSLRDNTGNNNVAIGYGSSRLNTSASNNTAIGFESLRANTTAPNNTATGSSSLRANTFGSQNVSIGKDSLLLQSFANSNTIWATNNTAVGFEALRANQPTSSSNGYRNTAVGASALRANTTGLGGTGIGRDALLNVTTGSSNTALGHNTGLGITTGENNTILGANVTGLSSSLNNNIILANGTGAIKAQHNDAGWTLTGSVVSTAGEFNLKTLTELGDADATLTASQLTGGLFTITPTEARTLTTGTAADIIANMAGSVDNSHFEFTIVNLAAFNVTLALGVDVTLVGKVILNDVSGTWRVRRLTSTTVAMYRM